MSPPAPLTDRQQAVLDVIRSAVAERGYPPSIREIGDAVGLSSSSSVHHQLEQLARFGYLRRDPSRPRAIEVVVDADTDLAVSAGAVRSVPLVGEIAAGAPIIAEERVDELYTLPRDLVGDGTLFALRVRGESMVQAGVLPGDLVVVRQQPGVEQGEMCAAMIDGEATVKTFRRTRDGRVFLDPANDGYEPIEMPTDAENAVIGKIVAVLRSM